MRRVYLIRHGTTAANEQRLYYGATDIGISEKGRAELTELYKNGGYPDAQSCRVFTSGMRRTVETLEILFPNTDFEVNTGLREMDFGKFEMRSYEEMKTDPEYIAWIEGDFMENICPGGESGNLHAVRAVKAFWEVFDSTDEDIIIISHSGTMTSVMQLLFPDEKENRWQWSCYGGCGYALAMDGHKAVNYKTIPEN